MTHRIRWRSDDPVFRLATVLVAVAALSGYGPGVRQPTPARTAFAAQVASLSEPNGYFDTDNLVSNERSYLEVLPDLDRLNVRGGAYIGVGPDQNFSYIAHIRPSVAYILDIRRDNLLLHLLFKAIFHQSRTRVEYLALLFGRAVPADVDAWRASTIARLAEYINRPGLDSKSIDAVHSRLAGVIKAFGVPLSADDLVTIDRFHRRFIESGLELQFQSAGRLPQPYYPTYKDLLLETDGKGNQRNYLASEEAFQFVKSLQQRDRIIPVVGNLSGPSALAGIGRVLGETGETLSALYASNVEFYLSRQGGYQRFVSNLGRVPHTNRSVVIRSRFGFGPSTSEVESVDKLLLQSPVAR